MYLKLDIILLRKSHNYGCFQDKAVYVHTFFRGAKIFKIGNKGMFLVIVKIFGKKMTES